jgi:hypothetical protein
MSSPFEGTNNQKKERAVILRQLLQQHLRLLQIERVEAFRKPAIHRSEQLASLLRFALVAPEACEAHGGAEFPRFGLLLASDSKGMGEMFFGLFLFRQPGRKHNFPSDAMDFSAPRALPASSAAVAVAPVPALDSVRHLVAKAFQQAARHPDVA